jgi:site-specific DNA-methyltransferase (adenine-specific)
VIHGDCYEIMQTIEAGSVALILTDPPYNTTACDFDKVPMDFERFWSCAKRVLKPNGAVVSTASQPFTTDLINSNRKWFRYCWVWVKSPTGFLNAKNMPMKSIEDVCVFYERGKIYNPQGLLKINLVKSNHETKKIKSDKGVAAHNGGRLDGNYYQEFCNYPDQLLYFAAEHGEHPTQKPVELFSYLIRTYTNTNALVLDPFAGSGTTGVAAHNTNRQFICIEKMEKYYLVAKRRIELAQAQLRFDGMVG